MFDRSPIYRSFVLTLWQEHGRGSSEPSVWRFRLDDPRTGQRRGFADLEALVAALEREMAANWRDEQGRQPHPAAQPGGQGRDPWADA
jgi:hypothetical protein